MINRDNLFGKIWWEDLNGPRRFLVEASNILSGGKSVVLCLPERVPWLEIMRDVLEKFLPKGTQTIKILNAKKIFDTPQEYVLKNFCANKRGFRAYNSTAYAKFLAESTGIELNDSCLWIRKASPAQVEQWLTFIAEYQKFLAGRKGGVFLLEAGDYWNVKSEVAILSYKKKISDYDSFAFNIFVAADFANENQLMKRYLAELVTALTEGDVEFGAACIAKSDDFLKNPAEVFKDLMWEFNSSKSTEDIEQAIWMTQLKLIFPLVETFRRNFVRRYEEQIRNFPAHHVPPEEVEIGALYTQFNTRRWLISEADANDLEFYREVRNKLAHLTALPFDELQKIFEKNSRR
ncbi:MAG: hypothetical protein IJR52_10865 [Selenomonadaceae bacterium]|nr:hypothetical protein [Selenomonadaceae bacterium]MBQ9498057.1 hypothetical protein [Selenomonadaceae bacterium]